MSEGKTANNSTKLLVSLSVGNFIKTEFQNDPLLPM